MSQINFLNEALENGMKNFYHSLLKMFWTYLYITCFYSKNSLTHMWTGPPEPNLIKSSEKIRKHQRNFSICLLNGFDK